MGGRKLATPKTRSHKPSASSTADKKVEKLSTKTAPRSPQNAQTPVSKSATPRVRMRASDFASKKRSSRKRRRETSEDADVIDNTLSGLRGALDGDGDGAKGGISESLLTALKRAKDAFENDDSGSSSDEDREADGAMQESTSKSGKPQTPTNSKKDNPKKKLFSTPETTPKSSRKEADPFLTPKQSTRKAQKREKSTGKKVKSQKASLKVTASAHKRDIAALKKEDPEFYKFLEENDTTLLEFDDDDELDQIDQGEDENENADQSQSDNEDLVLEKAALDSDVGHEKLKSESSGSDSEEDEKGSDTAVADKDKPTPASAVDEINGYSDESEDEDDERRAEEEAAAEAGIDMSGATSDGSDSATEGGESDNSQGEERALLMNSTKGDSERRSKKKIIFVDKAYLQGIKQQLKSSRSSLKAVKDLLRLFRAGKDMLPRQAETNKKKRKSNSRFQSANSNTGGEESDIDDEEFADDGSFTAGKVRFASAKAYQEALNLAIVGIQDALDRMLGKPQSKDGSSGHHIGKWDPTDSGRWMNLQPVFRSYVFHMLSLCDVVTDPATSRFLLKRLEKLVPYTLENKILLKRIVKIAIRLWSADPLHVSEASRLRAYLLLNKLAHGPGNAEIVLRSCCAAYASTIANVCNPRTLPTISFAVNCIVELFSVDMGASYTTAFSNLREMAISLRAVLVSKEEKEEVERIHNWSYINRLRLWSKVLGRYGAEDELQPLIYPYVQVSLGVMRVYATPRTFPLRLHVASYLTDVVAQTGTYIPLAPHLLSLLRCSELRKKPAHGNSKALEWRSLLRVSNDAIKTRPFLSGVIDGVVFQLANFFAIVSKHVSFPEISHIAQTTLRKFAKEVVVGEWKTRIMALAEKLRQTSDLIMVARGKADFSPQGAVSKEGMLASVPGMDPEKKTPIQRFFEVEFTRTRKQESLRDEKSILKQSEGSKAKSKKESDSSDSEGSEISAEPVAKRARKSGSGTNSMPAKKVKQILSIVGSDEDEEPDIVLDLDIDSDESSAES